ncbi:MAG TPA: ATP-binding protein [Holophaga sp.]|nr:ATP-binding protein [Holophaga sp.]HPS67293.1 ATP-binding protein [Holophaga sp.]
MERDRGRRSLPDRRLDEVVLRMTRMLIRREGRGLKRLGLLEEAARTLLELFQCEAVEIWSGQGTGILRYGVHRGGQEGYLPLPGEACPVTRMCLGLPGLEDDPACRPLGENGSFLVDLPREGASRPAWEGCGVSWRSLAVVPLGTVQEGVLVLAGHGPGWIRPKEIPCLEDVARIIGIGVAFHQPREALGERVKELTCLYGLSRLAQQSDLPLGRLLQGIAELVPPAWQYPESAHCRITFDGDVFESRGFRETRLRQGAALLVKGALRGGIEVFYSDEVSGAGQGSPFLAEESNLIEGLAREVALVIERRRLEEDREKLWEQIRHMDRLATVGQLAASMAHELNEPLCSILGLAQLASKDRELSQQAKGDLGKIIDSSLRARDVVRGLLDFSRAEHARRTSVSLNQVVEDALDLFRARCAGAKVGIRLDLDPGLPRVRADATQIHQVLVNLIVNALQAMPKGGTLTLGTRRRRKRVQLRVEDDGIGMGPETLRNIFVPFFTTKEAGHGTGLGLAIVQDIITTHGGTLSVESRPGVGSRFFMDLPLNGAGSGKER